MPKTTAEKIATKREQIQQLQDEEKQLIQKQKEQDRNVVVAIGLCGGSAPTPPTSSNEQNAERNT